MDKSTKTIVGIIAIGAIGVAIGILLAPDKGENTRAKIKDSFGGLDDKLEDFLENVSQKGEELIADLKEKLSNIQDKTDSNSKTA